MCQKCFYCGAQCIWQSDFSGEDYGYDDIELEDGTVIPADEQVVSIWVCPNCGSEYQIHMGEGQYTGNFDKTELNKKTPDDTGDKK